MRLTILSHVLLFLAVVKPISSTNSSGYGNFTMKEVFKRLIRDNPTIVLLDDFESELELRIRKSLESVDNAGSVVFTFNPWWRFWKQRLKPRIGALKSTPFRWTFICLIDEKRTKNRAAKYLEEILSIGHGRLDRFMLIGFDKYIKTFLKSKYVEKFQNILGIPVDKKFIYQRQLYDRPKRGTSRFNLVMDLQSVYWITSTTASLHGQHFRISGTKFPPYLDWTYDGKGGKQLMGQNYRIFHEASAYHNYTYEFNPTNEWKLTGQRYQDGTWDGVYGDLLNGKADIASVSTQTVDRNGLADFVGPFGRAHLIFVTSPPEKHLGKYTIFRSYTINAWLFILGFFAVFVILFYKGLQLSVKRGTVKSNRRLFSKALMLVWSLSFEQTEEKRPRGIRLLMIMWVAFIVVIGTGYRSNLAASISSPLVEQKPKTFKQLSEQTNYHINFDLSGISAWTHFEENNNSMITKIKKRSIQIENTTACVIQSFMDSATVCIGWDFTLKLAEAKNLTIPQLDFPLISSIESVWAAWYTFALEKNSIFTEAFQTIGQTFFEIGLTAFWRARLLNAYRREGLEWTNSQMNTRMYKKLAQIRRSSRTDTQPLRVENFEFIFIILITGLFLSFLRFCFEVWTVRKNLLQSNPTHDHGQTNAKRFRRITLTETKVIPIDFVP